MDAKAVGARIKVEGAEKAARALAEKYAVARDETKDHGDRALANEVAIGMRRMLVCLHGHAVALAIVVKAEKIIEEGSV